MAGMAGSILAHGRNIEAVRAEIATARIADSDDSAAHRAQQRRRDPTDITKSLNDNSKLIELLALLSCQLTHHQAHTTPCCLIAPKRATYLHRLPSDDGIHGMPFMHGDSVHKPGHDLGIGVHIGGRD